MLIRGGTEMAENDISKQDNPTLWAQMMAFHTFDLDEAVRCLDEDFPIRRINEVIDKAIKDKAEECGKTYDEVKIGLRQKLGPENTANLSNWLKPGKVKSINRNSAIRIAFALQMTYEKAEKFLKKCWHDGFYMRDVRDVIYVHGLQNGWNYEMAAEMAEGFSYLDRGNPDPEGSGSVQGKVTEYLSAQVSSAHTQEELAEIIRENEQFFGSFHRKAYNRFMELWDQLKQEWDELADIDYENDKLRGQAYTRDVIPMEELCRVIVKGIPEMRERGPNTIIRRLITDHIPGRTGIDEITKKSKRDGKIIEVDRKLLMLAWLASKEGFIEKYKKSGNAEVDFKEHMLVLNDLLKTHGMPELDARHPFDWIVMNSMRCGYIQDKEKKNEWIDDIEERMQALIERM
jgi:hypothetical protein